MNNGYNFSKFYENYQPACLRNFTNLKKRNMKKTPRHIITHKYLCRKKQNFKIYKAKISRTALRNI